MSGAKDVDQLFFYDLHRLIMLVPLIGSGGCKCCVLVGRDS